MSAQEFDQMDEELMGMVNDHAAPAAVADAEEIMEREAVRLMNEETLTGTGPAKWENVPKVEHTSEKCDFDDYLQETENGYRISKKQFDELEAKVEKTLRHKTIAAVIICAVMTVALLMVLAKPSLLIWLVNIGVAICCVITGIAIDRWCRR